MASDITERKRSKAALCFSEEPLKLIANLAPNRFYDVDNCNYQYLKK